MREAIERVIADLERAIVPGTFAEISQWDHGWNKALKLAIDKHKEVLNTANHNPRNPTEPERDGQQEQSQ